jgi:CelD/BcsL family acetyltransferase involved in cellulose biosynthesis
MREAGTGASIEVTPISGAELQSLRPEWSELECHAPPIPYQTFDWLACWTSVYQPKRLLVVRVASADRALLALGLLERLPLGRLRFAGGAVTPVRGLLSRTGHAELCWEVLADWLGHGSRSHTVAGQGIPPADAPLLQAVATPEAWFRIELPDSFDQYLAERPGDRRRDMRRRIRIAEADGAAVAVEEADLTGALELFTRFHRNRAAAKSEIHEAIDDRLVEMLALLAQARPGLLRVYVLERRRETIAVALNFESGDASWAYNTGFSLDAARISPGVVLRLGSIRDAIERGSRCFDFGPGASKYKRELGAVEYERLRIELSSTTAAGRGARALALSRRRLHEVEWLRRAAGQVRLASGRISDRRR